MSGPVALSGLRSLSSCSTPFDDVIPSMMAYGLGPLSGMLAVSSLSEYRHNLPVQDIGFHICLAGNNTVYVA